jgi:hypothetical protein
VQADQEAEVLVPLVGRMEVLVLLILGAVVEVLALVLVVAILLEALAALALSLLKCLTTLRQHSLVESHQV